MKVTRAAVFTRLGRRLAGVLVVLGIVLVGCAQPSAADPASPPVPGDSAGAVQVPTGLPAGLRQYVAGTAEFKAAAWSVDCRAGGSSAGPNRDERTGVANASGKAGGIDVGRYLESAAQYLPLLSWWTQPQDSRITWWKNYYRLYQRLYPGDAAVRDRSPQLSELPGSPATVAGSPQYPHGYCSSELGQWATPAAAAAGFSWEQSLDATTIAHDVKSGSPDRPEQKTPCDKRIDNGQWCSIAYYVDCSRATGAGAGDCTHWNDAVSILIYQAYHWVRDNQSYLSKLGDFFTGVAVDAAGFGLDVADFFAKVGHAIAAVVDFFASASGAWEKFVNEMKHDATSLVTAVLKSYNQTSTWDVGARGFLGRYALVEGLGIILLAFMFLGAIRRAMDSGDRDELPKVMKRLAVAIATMLWAPAAFQFLEQNATHATDDLAGHFTGGQIGTTVSKLAGLNGITSTIPGGGIIGFVLFLLILIGAAGLFIGLMVQRYGMEVAATLIPLAFGVYVHPRFKRKVEKATFTVVGLILAKPLTILVLGAAFGVINDGLSFHGSPMKVLGGLTLAAIGLVTAGLAPFALLKWAPVLPTSADSMDHQRGGGRMMSGAVLGGAAVGAGRAVSRASGPSGGMGRQRRSGSSVAGEFDRKQVVGANRATGAAGSSGAAGGPGGGARAGGPQGSPGSRTGRALGTGMRGTARAAGSAAGAGLSAAGRATDAGLTRGRALSQNQAPQVDLPDGDDVK